MSVGWWEQTLRARERDRGAGETSQLGISLYRDKSSRCEMERSDFFWLALSTLWLLSHPFCHTVPTKQPAPWLEACVLFLALCHPEDMFS